MNNPAPLLLARDIQRDYTTGDSVVHVLRGVDLEIAKGEIVAVTGPSGVGKSTLLNILGALDRPTSGSVTLEGVDLHALSDGALASLRNRRIGFVFQFHHLLPEFTALENVLMPGLIGRSGVESLRERAAELLSAVDMSDRLTHRPAELSGGERQRVAVARALFNEPSLILADEPTGNLDRENGERLRELLWELARKHGGSLLVVTHNPDIAAQADCTITLFDGVVQG